MDIKTATDLINEAKGRIRQVMPQQLMQDRAAQESTVVIDCREPNEWNLGRIPGALFIPRLL